MSTIAEFSGSVSTSTSTFSPRYHNSTSSVSSSLSASDNVATSSGKRAKSISSLSSTSSPRKKASPSDVIFGKPPGSDLASRAYGALNADGSSSNGSGNGSGPNIHEALKKVSPIAPPQTHTESSNGTGTDSCMQPEATSAGTSVRTVEGKDVAGLEAETNGVKLLPGLFEDAEADDIVILVADMLTRLTVHNDQLPLHPTSLTRFHSRATPSISILSYLKRITKYTSLEKSCTLILLIYIDRVCERISGFTICSLTVHRFICAAVVCASKALCDSFSTNGHYARVGGISLIELNMLEKEFLNIINWKLSCSGALLQHYYTSLVDSHQSFQLKSIEQSKEGENCVKDAAEEIEMRSTNNGYQ